LWCKDRGSQEIGAVLTGHPSVTGRVAFTRIYYLVQVLAVYSDKLPYLSNGLCTKIGSFAKILIMGGYGVIPLKFFA